MVTVEHGGELAVTSGRSTPSGDEVNYENLSYGHKEENPEQREHYYNQQEPKQDKEVTYYNQRDWGKSGNDSVYYNDVVIQGP